MKYFEKKRMSLGEATMMVDKLSPNMETCFLGGPEDFHKTLFSEAFNHIVIPTEKFIKDQIHIGSGNGKLNVIEAPPGTGKTHAFTYDLLWRGLKLFRNYTGSPNMIAMFTSPDTSVNEAVVSDLKAVIKWAKTNTIVRDIILKDYGLDIHNVATRPDELLGYGTEILVCTPKMATEVKNGQNDILMKLKEETFLAFIISDEAHRGLGCPSSKTYDEDIGWSGYGYNATWFHGLRKLNAFVWIGLSGTPTKSQKSDDVYYNVISDKMTKASFRNGFVDILDMSSMSMEEIVEKVFLDITERNAISKYLFTYFTRDNLGKELYEKFEKALKVTAMFRSGQKGNDGTPSKWGTAEDVQNAWDRLVKKYVGTTFKYFCPWNKETVELERNPGKCAICTHEKKTGKGTSKDVFDLLNAPKSGYDAVAVLHIGVVGINITTLGHIGIIPEVGNDGDVESSPVQLMGRLARCPFVWTGIGWSIPVSEIEDRDLREIAIHLSINITTKRCTSNESYLIERAWNRFEQGHIELAGAYTYLSELVNEATRTLYDYSLVKEQDDIYKLYKVDNPHCEFCAQNEDGIPECEMAARKNHSEDSDEDFAKFWFGDLEVDHIDGDHTNNDPENLQTLCSDEHGYKTQKNKDYLNRYDENNNLITAKLLMP